MSLAQLAKNDLLAQAVVQKDAFATTLASPTQSRCRLCHFSMCQHLAGSKRMASNAGLVMDGHRKLCACARSVDTAMHVTRSHTSAQSDQHPGPHSLLHCIAPIHVCGLLLERSKTCCPRPFIPWLCFKNLRPEVWSGSYHASHLPQILNFRIEYPHCTLVVSNFFYIPLYVPTIS